MPTDRDPAEIHPKFSGMARGPGQRGIAVVEAGRVRVFRCQPIVRSHDRDPEFSDQPATGRVLGVGGADSEAPAVHPHHDGLLPVGGPDRCVDPQALLVTVAARLHPIVDDHIGLDQTGRTGGSERITGTWQIVIDVSSGQHVIHGSELTVDMHEDSSDNGSCPVDNKAVGGAP
jgi:hypothetical protein